MKNKIDYSKLSDFEINKLVATKQGLIVSGIDDSTALGMTTAYHEKYPNTLWCAKKDSCGRRINPWEQVNYCESWEDMGPLIRAHEIGINKISDEWEAHNGAIDQGGLIVGASVYSMDENPLRAAAIVYLMMDGENEK